MTLAAVSDAGPLIHLAEIDSLELLVTFDTLLAPETVYKEVDAVPRTDIPVATIGPSVHDRQRRVGAADIPSFHA